MRTNEKITPIHEFDDINVRVDYFWADKEGKLNNWNDQVNLPIGWLHARVKIDLLEFTETFETTHMAMDVRVTRLYVNDEFIGELTDISIVDNILKCAVLVGYN